MPDTLQQPPDGPDAEAARVHDEAQRHHDAGEYAAARSLFERALALRRSALGDDALPTAETLGALALVLAQQGEPAPAQAMIERVLAVRERILGPDHPDVAEALNNLGFMRRAQGDAEGARRLYERALAIRERVLGPDHPLTASSLSNLGVLAAAQREYAAARRYHERALSIFEQAAEPDDLRTGRALNNLAAVLADQGDVDAALELLARALDLHERAVGPRHASVANVLTNLADLHYKRRDYAAARSLYERALIIRQRTLGAAHPRTAEAVTKLLGALSMAQEFAQAIPLNRIAQALRRAPGRPDAATEEALRAFVDQLDARANRPPLSPDDQRALAEATELLQRAEALIASQDFGGAQAALERALVLREGVFGPDDFDLTPLLRALAMTLQAQGEYERQRQLQERIVALHVRALGQDHPLTLMAQAQAMSQQIEDKGWEAAFPMMEQLHAALSRQATPDHPLAQAAQQTSVMMEQLKALRQQQQPGAPEQPPAAPVPERAVSETLAGLDDVPWRALLLAYGPATDVPSQLRALLAPDAQTRGRALRQLYGNIWHQGSVYEATAHAVPFLIKLLAYPGTPDRTGILYLLAAIAESGGSASGDPTAKAAHDAVSAGLGLYLDLLDPAHSQELRAAAIATLTAFPERSAQSVSRLQAALAMERDAQTRLWLLWALGQVMDESEEANAYFADIVSRTADPDLAFLAAAALAGRTGEATPPRAVEALLAAIGAADGAESNTESNTESNGETPDLDDEMAPLASDQWPGMIEFAVERLATLGEGQAEQALARALQRTRDGDAARAVAEALLDRVFNDGQIRPKGVARSRLPDGRWKVAYWEAARPPERGATTLTASQRLALEALAAHDPFWAQEHDLLTLYGLPATRDGLDGLLAQP
jgi:tetratricopeptide (TPR) repeat protein